MIHLGRQSTDWLKLRSTLRQEGVWMFLGVSGSWLSVWLLTSADSVAWEGFTHAQRHVVRRHIRSESLPDAPDCWFAGHELLERSGRR